MVTAVDSSILIDIFNDDPIWADSSENMLRKCVHEGRVVACDVVWTEVGAVFQDVQMFEDAMKKLPIEFSPISMEAATLAGNLWRQYRTRGGRRDRVVPDFLIAAHAMTQCDRLLSRDRGFYRDYFDRLTLLDPSKS